MSQPVEDQQVLLQWILADPLLNELYGAVAAEASEDPSHDVGHVLRVALWTLRLAEAGVDRREALAAALLHDLVNPPKSSPERSRASELSAARAAELLSGGELAGDAIERICEAIRDHSFSRGATPRSSLGRALQDADRLDALGALGILRTATTGARMGADYFDARDPWAERRPLDDRRHTVDHFFVKLLKLPATMQTPAGRREAEHRATLMRAFLVALGEEIGVPAPAAVTAASAAVESRSGASGSGRGAASGGSPTGSGDRG